MTNLTELWKKGELPEGWYYVKDIHNKVRLDRYFKETDNFEYLEDWEVGEVLAQVPSYEEYQKFLSDQLAKNEGEEINAELQAENKQLKDLLKECKSVIKGAFLVRSKEMCDKIDEVLK